MEGYLIRQFGKPSHRYASSQVLDTPPPKESPTFDSSIATSFVLLTHVIALSTSFYHHAHSRANFGWGEPIIDIPLGVGVNPSWVTSTVQIQPVSHSEPRILVWSTPGSCLVELYSASGMRAATLEVQGHDAAFSPSSEVGNNHGV